MSVELKGPGWYFNKKGAGWWLLLFVGGQGNAHTLLAWAKENDSCGGFFILFYFICVVKKEGEMDARALTQNAS